MREVIRYLNQNGQTAYRLVQSFPHPDPALAEAGETVHKWLDRQSGEHVLSTVFPRDSLTADKLSGPFRVSAGQNRDIVIALLGFIDTVEATGGIEGGALVADPEWWDLMDEYKAACAAVRKKKLINGRYK